MEKKSNYVAIYVPTVDFLSWELFKKICEREGVSPSGKIRDFFKEYNSKHCEGNPQTMLEFSNLPKMLPRWKTCRWSSKKLVKNELLCRTRIDSHSYIKTPNRCDGCVQYREG